MLVVFLPNFELGQFADPDAHMRLVRAEVFLDDLDLQNHQIERSNSPYGEELHWSRPLDFVLTLGSWPLRQAIGQKEGMAWLAFWIAPVFFLIFLVSSLASAQRFLDGLTTFHFGLLLCCQPALLGYFFPGRPDHHLLLILLFSILAGTMLKQVGYWPIWAGVWAGLAAWVSVEAVIYTIPAFLFFSLKWIGNDQLIARQAAQFSLSWLLVSLFAVTLETPSQLLDSTMTDRLSGMHLLAQFLCLLVWMVLHQIGQRCQAKAILRTITLSILGITSLTILYYACPLLFQGPYGGVDEELKTYWLGQVAEVQPLGHDFFSSLKKSIVWVFPLYLGIGYTLSKFTHWKKWFRQDQVQLLGIYLLFMTPLSFMQIRWSVYSEFLWSVPAAIALSEALTYIKTSIKPPWKRLARISTILFFCGGGLIIFLVMNLIEAKPDSTENDNPSESMSNSRPQDLCQFLTNTSASPKTILARLELGPEILYRTHHRVIATPYHRNAEGVLFLRETMISEDFEDTRESLSSRGVDWIVLQPSSKEHVLYRGHDPEKSFYQALKDDLPPDWLAPVQLPEDLQGQYKLYQVSVPPKNSP